MRVIYFRFVLIFAVFFVSKSSSQETLPIYQDYLSDNVYLIHPSAAGIGNSSKLRLTARQQWAGIPNAPALQTLSYHSKVGDYSNAAYGLVLFNDKNGFHSQKGIQGTYAYHLPMGNGKLFNQLSFGLSFTFVQNQSDQRSFFGDRPNVINQIIQSTSYYNADFSVAYHLDGFSSYFTVKNLFLTAKNSLNVQETLDLKNYVLSAGYFFGEGRFIQLEPSIMIQLREGTGDRIADINLKAYKKIGNSSIWAALSYRKYFESNSIENSKFITPIIGLNYKNLMFSYTYTRQLNDVVLTSSGFHQVSLGINLKTTAPRAAACPNINSNFGGF
ncbi:type IX secretion system membrane protein PorP/SprF [uncultured Polaribacter sp.]|uniref:PorP/SprF family type IX secretion system membrane protein n=1 Tax=uncultured Polaribacter sp. TaxID=174711 RepID=UPI00259BD68F|nr:type IX secretion system membrane protein PorP/SprF [uncultured Polaribacter sp.]